MTFHNIFCNHHSWIQQKTDYDYCNKTCARHFIEFTKNVTVIESKNAETVTWNAVKSTPHWQNVHFTSIGHL